jgi:hypothetical protein
LKKAYRNPPTPPPHPIYGHVGIPASCSDRWPAVVRRSWRRWRRCARGWRIHTYWRRCDDPYCIQQTILVQLRSPQVQTFLLGYRPRIRVAGRH